MEPKEGNVVEASETRPEEAVPSDQPLTAGPNNLQVLGDNVLQFLSNANNESIGACLAGLGAATYLLLGRLGLLLIGVVGGVVLHATWEKGAQGSVGGDVLNQRTNKSRESGLETIKRLLDWRDRRPEKDSKTLTESTDVFSVLYGDGKLDYTQFSNEVCSALDDLTDAVIRDYVDYWYGPVLPQELSFPHACRQTLTAFVLAVSFHLSRKRPTDMFLTVLTNSTSLIVVYLSELSLALQAAPPNSSAAEAVYSYLQSYSDGSLAQMADRHSQRERMYTIADDILQSYLEPKAYNCEPVRLFLREIVAKLILESTLDRCCKAEYINSWIVYLLEDSDLSAEDALASDMDEKTSSKLHSDLTAKTGVKTGQADSAANERYKKSTPQHVRAVSKAQEAMDEAMREAQRLTQLIAEDEARKHQDGGHTLQPSLSETSPEDASQGLATPASSQSDLNGSVDFTSVSRSSYDLDLAPATDPAFSGHDLSGNSPFTENFDAEKDQVSHDTEDQGSNSVNGGLAPLTLFNASISIFDDSVHGEKGKLKAKPSMDYLIQIEPANANHPGWMIARKYAAFESLHEILRRISKISGAAFAEQHASLPSWKGNPKAVLRSDLERYLNDAIRFRPLADSEGIKRFFEKDDAMNKLVSHPGKNTFSLEGVGKGMIGVISKAPKEVAGGGKAIIDGVTGVLGGVGNLGQKKGSVSGAGGNSLHIKLANAQSKVDQDTDSLSGRNSGPPSKRSLTPVIDTQPDRNPQMERRPSSTAENDQGLSQPRSSARSSFQLRGEAGERITTPTKNTISTSPVSFTDLALNLPPEPREVSYSQLDASDSNGKEDIAPKPDLLMNISPSSKPTAQDQPAGQSIADSPEVEGERRGQRNQTATDPLTEEETQVAIGLFFAVINELYTLSSAWNFRRTLLNAARTFLLRPKNPQLENIRILLQESFIDSNFSSKGIASHLRTLRANSLPTAEELLRWPPPLSDKAKVDLREKARRLLIQKGVPLALTSVMGNAASGEALGKVFDCLQVEQVARGLVFGLMLQCMRVITQ